MDKVTVTPKKSWNLQLNDSFYVIDLAPTFCSSVTLGVSSFEKYCRLLYDDGIS